MDSLALRTRALQTANGGAVLRMICGAVKTAMPAKNATARASRVDFEGRVEVKAWRHCWRCSDQSIGHTAESPVMKMQLDMLPCSSIFIPMWAPKNTAAKSALIKIVLNFVEKFLGILSLYCSITWLGKKVICVGV